MNITSESFGRTPEGEEVTLFTLTNAHGLRVSIMTYGATIVSIETPDRNGALGRITLRLESLDDYLRGHPYIGSTVGRCVNRMRGSRIRIDGAEHRLSTNFRGAHHLHGGLRGFDKVVWKAQPLQTADWAGVVFSHESPDGDEGYPGNLSVNVTYGLTENDEWTTEYLATTDKATVVNLTNHAYWNLANGGSSDVLGHELTIHAHHCLALGDDLIPTGGLRAVKDTPLDFTRPTTIGSKIDDVKPEGWGGYDYCYVIDRPKGIAPGNCPDCGGKARDNGTVPFRRNFAKQAERLLPAARLREPGTGRVMDVFTTLPSVQLASGNSLGGRRGAGGQTYGAHFGLCLETQHYPDAPNHPEFPSVVLRPGQRYEELTVHRFSVDGE